MLKLRHAALLALGLAAPTLVRAQQLWTVGPGQQFATIQQGINAASNGDEVLVSPGTYVENIDFKGKGISVANGGTTLGIAIIDGSGAGPVVTITGATGAFLHGFTIQNGGKPQATNGPQGGIYIANSTATIENNTLVNNFCAGINATASNVNVFEDDISKTLTTGCGAAEGLGSGVAITGYLATAPNPNGNPTAYILQNTIHNNTGSVAFTDRGGGGALNITNVPFASVDYNKMYGNVTTGYGGAFYLANTPQLIFNNNLVYGNKGVSGGLDIVFPNQNVGPLLGLIVGNTITDNTATTTGTNAGSDIYISGNLGRYALVNNIVVGYTNNQVAVNCGTAYQSQTVTPLIVDHNDFYSVPGSGNTPIGGFCTSANAPAQLGNISKDPLFVHGTAADIAGTSGNAVDLSLQAASPAIDTGNNSGNTLPGDTQNASAQDLANHPRITNGGNGGLTYPVVDMGAYEYQPGTAAYPLSDTVISLAPSSFTPASGNPVTLTATITTNTSTGTGQTSAAPTGSINFLEDYTVVGSGIITANGTNGTATLTLTNLTPGIHHLQAVYTGQGAFPPGLSVDVIISATVGITTQSVTTIASSLNPSNVGQLVTFTGNVSSSNGVPDGQMVFSLDTSSTLCAAQAVDASGNATCSTSTLTAGSHIITASFIPNGTAFTSSSASLTQKVNALPLANTLSTLVVTPLNTTYGDPVTLTATVVPAVPSSGSPTPTGSVAFFDQNSALLGSATLVNGVASLTITTLNGGPHNISCKYGGDSIYATSTCNVVAMNVMAAPTTLSVTSGTNPSPAVTPVTFTAQLLSGTTPVAGATITINAAGLSPQSGILSGPTTGITNAQGIATVTYAGFYPGAYGVKATYAGDASHAASASTTIPETVFINPTTMTLIAAPNPAVEGTAVTLAVDVAATTTTTPPPGSVTILDGGTPLVTLPLTLNGALSSASFTTSSLVAGTHNLTATYTPTVMPDTAFLPTQTTAALAIVITPLSFDLSTDNPTISIQTEHHGAMTLTVTPVGNYIGTVSLACTGTLPPVLQCEFAKNQVLVSGAAASTTLTLETDAVVNFWGSLAPQRERTKHREELALATLLPLALLGLTRKRRKLARAVLLSTLFALLSVSLTGCGDKWPDHTPPGTYDIAITATGNANQRDITKTIHVTLIVTP